MNRIANWPVGLIVLILGLLSGSAHRLLAEPPHKAWLESWQQQNQVWRAVHLIGPQPQRLPLTRQLISDVLAPMGINVLILEVDYGFQYQSHAELECRGINKDQARELAALCRRHGIRLIPLFNCLGHQSWASHTGALLKKYPQFDETPHVSQDNKGIYCREWCPSHPDVHKIVCDLLDELIDAFEADALHVGMDEVFLIGDEKCPRCKGKDVGKLFAQVVNDLHRHLVAEKGVEMLLWGDRLLDAATFPYGKWEASETGSHRAIDLIPKDIIVCDWHYGRRADYPSVRFFQQKGFRVLPSTWNNPDGAVALVRNACRDATERMLGILFTGWSAGGNGEYLLAALTGREDVLAEKTPAKRLETGKQIAAAIRAGMKELAAAAAPTEAAAPALVEVRRIWNQAPHNAFTDLIRFQDRWYCVFREGAAHVSPDGALRVITSVDGNTWESAALITSPNSDLRDAKITVTPGGRLMLCGAEAINQPLTHKHQSLSWFSDDGRQWSDRCEIGARDYWLWRVTWHRGKAYGFGYGTQADKSIRFYRSTDGKHFDTLVPKAFDADYPNETSLVFLEDDTCYCLLRRDAGTATAQLGTARPPYTEWAWKDLGVRIGGPHMIRLPDGRFIAVVRRYDGGTRTSLCRLDPDRGTLTEVLRLPSGGDTSYAGLVWHDGLLWISYYSSHEGKTSVYLAKVKF